MEASSQTNGAAVLTLRRAPGHGPDPTVTITESTSRLLGAAAVLAIAVIHILDSVSTYHGTRWIFWAYMAVIVAAVPVALLLMHWASPLVWLAAVGVAAGPFLGYLWSRAIGLPGDPSDVGNWLCTLGMTALFVEASLLGLGATRLEMWRRSRARAFGGQLAS